jgi:hypothetical protein
MKKMLERVIDITGNARNINGKPALVAENVGTYFIEGMNQWERGWEHKKIRIIGDLNSEEKTNLNTISKPVVQLL